MMIIVEKILEEREKTHGEFSKHAAFTQQIKAVMRPCMHRFTTTQYEALEMIAHKIARILSGDPNHKDHWDDIAGYAMLVSKELDKNATQKPVMPKADVVVDKYQAFKV